jgi:hypothetical protein
VAFDVSERCLVHSRELTIDLVGRMAVGGILPPVSAACGWPPFALTAPLVTRNHWAAQRPQTIGGKAMSRLLRRHLKCVHCPRLTIDHHARNSF